MFLVAATNITQISNDQWSIPLLQFTSTNILHGISEEKIASIEVIKCKGLPCITQERCYLFRNQTTMIQMSDWSVISVAMLHALSLARPCVQIERGEDDEGWCYLWRGSWLPTVLDTHYILCLHTLLHRLQLQLGNLKKIKTFRIFNWWIIILLT